MGDKTKALCKWSKSRFQKNEDLLVKILSSPRFYCRDCGRAAGEKKWLCKPVKLVPGDD